MMLKYYFPTIDYIQLLPNLQLHLNSLRLPFAPRRRHLNHPKPTSTFPIRGKPADSATAPLRPPHSLTLPGPNYSLSPLD
jgi:hypothetical protein